MSTITTQKPADAILVIDARAKRYASARSDLADRVQAYQEELRKLQVRFAPIIKERAAKAADAQAALEAEIHQRPDLFVKPRTMTLHGIKVGFQKGKGKVEWADADKVVERIRAQFSKAEAELLLDIKTTPRKEGLLTLDVATLKKLGVTVTGTDDAVYIKAADTEIDKLVARLLDEGSKPTEEEAA